MGKSLLIKFYEELLELKRIRQGGAAHQRLKFLLGEYDQYQRHTQHNYKKLYKEYRDINK